MVDRIGKGLAAGIFHRQKIVVLSLLLTLFQLVGIAWGAAVNKEVKFPSKPIRIVIPAAPGGGLGQEITVIAPYLEKYTGVKTIIDYVPGADGIISYNKFTRDKPDGYTVSYFSTSSAIQLELTRGNAKFSLKNFSSIGAWNIKTLVLLSHPERWNSFADFLSEAKQKKVSMSGTGGATETQYRLMEMGLGVKFNYVPYASSAQSTAAVAGKHIDALLAFTGSSLSMLRAGKLKALAALSPQPDPFLPGVPTLKELGREGVPLLVAYGMFAAPPHTPKEKITLLEKAIRSAAADPGLNKLSQNLGHTVDFKSSPELKKAITDYYQLLEQYKTFIK